MGKLRLAYNTNGLAHHRLADAIDLLADLGYDGIALTPDVNHLDPSTVTPRQIRDVAAQLRRRKHQPTLLDPDAAARRQRLLFLIRCLDIGRDLGASVVAFWSGAPPGRAF